MSGGAIIESNLPPLTSNEPPKNRTQALVRKFTETILDERGEADHRKEPSSSHPQKATEKSDESTQAFVWSTTSPLALRKFFQNFNLNAESTDKRMY
jgi:hypothetical protein